MGRKNNFGPPTNIQLFDLVRQKLNSVVEISIITTFVIYLGGQI